MNALKVNFFDSMLAVKASCEPLERSRDFLHSMLLNPKPNHVYVVYCKDNYATKLQENGANVDVNISNIKVLQNLDTINFKDHRIVCVTELSLMRGFDYITTFANLSLILLRGFPNESAYVQALMRTGRNGQSTQRYTVQGENHICKEEKKAYNAKIGKIVVDNLQNEFN